MGLIIGFAKLVVLQTRLTLREDYDHGRWRGFNQLSHFLYLRPRFCQSLDLDISAHGSFSKSIIPYQLRDDNKFIQPLKRNFAVTCSFLYLHTSVLF